MQKKLIALAVASLASTGAFAAFDANIEFDNLYQNRAENGSSKGLSQSGRVELNASGKVGADMFVAGRASFLAKKDGTAATDDMWFQFGNSAVDLKLGRFEAADLFPIPRDAYIPFANVNSLGNKSFVYRGSVLRGRTGGDTFHGALTLNIGGGLSAELGIVENDKSSGSVNADTGAFTGNVKGLRPVLSYASGPLMLRGGFESFSVGEEFLLGQFRNSKKASGFGLTGSYDLGGITLSANYASAKLKYTAFPGNKSTTYGLFANTSMGLAAGYIASEDTADNLVGKFKTTTLYAAYTMPLFDIKGASMTTAIATSDGGGALNNAEKVNGVKVRFNYAF